MFIPNLIIIAGTGTKSGKTSMACKIIEQFKTHNITAIKISPHLHETSDGLIALSEEKGYAIYEETNGDTTKDTSRMLRSGASKVYFATVWDDKLPDVFFKIMKDIPADSPVICESPALRNFVEPGVFILMTSGSINKFKDINHLKSLPHLMFKLEELKDLDQIPIRFAEGKWEAI